MKLRDLRSRLFKRSRVEVGGGEASEVFAGRAITAGQVILVPVLESRARIGETGLQASRSVGGSTRVAFLGAWIEQASQPPRWLPLEETPPQPEKDWDSWLRSRPQLMDEIATALTTESH